MAHPKKETSLIIIKPDGIQRGLIGEVMHRFERKGLKITGLKMTSVEDAILEEHYAHIKDKPFFAGIKKYMKSSPVIVMAISGINAVSAIRTIVGPTRGHEAPAGTIRGDFSMSSQSNIVHASDSVESAEKEIKRFFGEGEVFDYERVNFPYIYADEAF